MIRSQKLLNIFDSVKCHNIHEKIYFIVDSFL